MKTKTWQLTVAHIYDEATDGYSFRIVDDLQRVHEVSELEDYSRYRALADAVCAVTDSTLEPVGTDR